MSCAASRADASVAVIGPAGEHGVRYASIVTCRDHQLPRLGFGAVLGAKQVKAIVCVGNAPVPVVDPAAVARVATRYAARIPGQPARGVAARRARIRGVEAEPGYAPVANFADTPRRGGVDPATAPPIERVAACPGCPTGCMKVYGGAALHQEALAMLGTNIGFDDPWSLHTRCVQLGVDPVSFGGTLAAAGSLGPDVPRASRTWPAVAIPRIAEGAARLTGPGGAAYADDQ